MNEVKGVGRAILASVFLIIGGGLNIVYGIAAIGNSRFFVHDASYMFAHLRGWGWVTLILGILELVAAMSLLSGNAFGRWFAIFAAGFAAIAALLDLPASPFWSLAVFALSLWIIHGLVQYGETASSTAT